MIYLFCLFTAALFGAASEDLKVVIDDGVRYIQRNTSFLSEVHTISFTGAEQFKPSNSVYSALEESKFLFSCF